MRVALVALLLAGCVRYQAQTMTAEPDAATLHRASVSGKYSGLLLTFEAPEDVQRYGPYHDYGLWKGRTYKGVGPLPEGYWVYVEPVWYVWAQPAAIVSGAVVPTTPSGTGCAALATECCLPDGRVVRPGGCQPDYPNGVEPATQRGAEGQCVRIECRSK